MRVPKSENIFRQAKELIETKTCGEFTDQDIKLINRALFPAINLFPKLGRHYDDMPISELLDELARMVDGDKDHG